MAPERLPLEVPVRSAPDGSIGLVVPPFAERERLDGFLVHFGGIPGRSRAEWQKLIGLSAVLLNGQPSRPSQRVAALDRILVAASPPHLDLPAQQEVEFAVVYADPAMIVVDKPAGLVVHPAPGNESGTLVNGLLARFPELRDATGTLRPGIVHRLDKDTSGLMVVARTAMATAQLQRDMQERSTEKRYLLLARGNLDDDEGFVDAPIARDLRDRQRMSVRAGGRVAQTRFWVRERLPGYTLIEALLVTGRTHQLRVHFAFIGHPVAGDATYGKGRAPIRLARQFLHSHVLQVTSPHDGREQRFVSPLPADLTAVLEALRSGRPGQRQNVRAGAPEQQPR